MRVANNTFNKSVFIEDHTPGESYFCPFCNQPVFIKNGKIRAPHFSHYPAGKNHTYKECTESWSYDMTEWHIKWQDNFPKECREIIVVNNDKKHIADVLINNTVIEFQHSSISVNEFNERNKFYISCGYKVLWVFDLKDEYRNKYIIPGNNHNGSQNYSWTGNKKGPFRGLYTWDNDITIYAQFTSEDCGIEMISYAHDGFKTFYTNNRHVYTEQEFVSIAKDNISKLIQQKVAKIDTPQKYAQIGGKTITDLWLNSYQFFVVENLHDNSQMLIGGRRGIINTRKDHWNPAGKIEGKYVNYGNDGRYRYSPKKYIVTNADQPIWKIVYSRERDYQKEAAEDKEREIKRLEQQAELERQRQEQEKQLRHAAEELRKRKQAEYEERQRLEALAEQEAEKQKESWQKYIEKKKKEAASWELVKATMSWFDSINLHIGNAITPAISPNGYHWVKCSYCGRLGTKMQFAEISKSPPINYGICKKCREKTDSQIDFFANEKEEIDSMVIQVGDTVNDGNGIGHVLVIDDDSVYVKYDRTDLIKEYSIDTAASWLKRI